MEEQRFLETILGFSKPWHIVSVVQADDKVEIKLDFPRGTRFVCPNCGKENTAYDTKWKKYRHLDLWQYQTFLQVRVPRIKCCKNKETVEVEWLRKGSKFTQMMEAHILEMAKSGSISKQAKILRITDTRMWRVILYNVNKSRSRLKEN